MKITLEERKLNTNTEKLYQKLLRTYSKLHDRLDNTNNREYKNYGGRGVTCIDKWKTFKGFLDDVDHIVGWDKNKFMSNQIELDKDIKVLGNKVYGLDTCLWVSHKENMQVRPSAQNRFIAYNEYTQEIKYGYNQVRFSEDNELSLTTINAVLRGIKHRAGDWYMWKENDELPVPKRYYFIDKDGNKYWDVNPRRLSIKLNKDSRYISSIISKNKVPKNCKFYIEDIDLHKLLIDKSSTTIEHRD